MNYRRIITLLVAGLCLSLVLPAGIEAQEPFRIGSIFSVTGPLAYLGDHMKKTVEYYVEKKTKEGGIDGRRIELIAYDTGSETTKAVLAAKRLIEQDKVDIIVCGGNSSGLALGIVPVVEKAGVPFISCEGAKAIVEPADQKRWVFKAISDDENMVLKLIEFWKAKGITKVALMTDTGGFGKSAKAELQRLMPGTGIEILAWEEFDFAATDLTPQLTKIKGTDARAILAWTAHPSGVVFLKNAKQLGLSDRMLVHSWGFVDPRYMNLAGDAAEGLYLTAVKFPVAEQLPDKDPIKANLLQYIKEYRARFGEAPNLYGTNGYDAAHLAFYALGKAGKDKAQIREALEGVRNLCLAQGCYTYSPTRHRGLGPESAVIIRWEKGGWKLAHY